MQKNTREKFERWLCCLSKQRLFFSSSRPRRCKIILRRGKKRVELFSLEGGENLRDSISKSCSFEEKKFGEKLSFSLPICSSIFRFLLDSRSSKFHFRFRIRMRNGEWLRDEAAFVFILSLPSCNCWMPPVSTNVDLK